MIVYYPAEIQGTDTSANEAQNAETANIPAETHDEPVQAPAREPYSLEKSIEQWRRRSR